MIDFDKKYIQIKVQNTPKNSFLFKVLKFIFFKNRLNFQENINFDLRACVILTFQRPILKSI